MKFADPHQKFQDWFTQQWAIIWGKQINPESVPWLMGPFGIPDSTTMDVINHISENENLTVKRNADSHGLLSSIEDLKLTDEEMSRLSQNIIDFYEKTGLYNLKLTVQWNPVFRVFGKLVSYLFSSRIGQLNIPNDNYKSTVKSEIITLSDSTSGKIKYTFWYRTLQPTGQIVYSGVYTTCILPSGKVCIKAVFPLPKGNATVILSPEVGKNGELVLDSSGKKFGDPGFYFLLNDSEGNFWSQYIKSFRDQLAVSCHDGNIFAEQRLTLWYLTVLRIKYEIYL